MDKWVGFFFRGFMALLISIVLFQPDPSFLNGRFYIGFFFLVNGILSFKIAKQLETKDKWTIVAAFVSIIGGVIVVLLRLSTLILALYSLPPLDLGKYLFAPIAIIIGLFQVLGRIRVTPDLGYKLVARRFSLVLGILEILLGIAVFIYEPVDWQVIIIGHIWIIIVMLVMFATAYRVRKIETSQRLAQPVSQK
ncbi:MAG: hypothetical protein ACLPY5_02020 [Candidatus Bathyarchaeia archaeon]